MSFPGSTFISFIPQILQLFSDTYPKIGNIDGFIGIKESLFQLLYTILLSHSNTCSEVELQIILNAFYYSFQRLSDLSVFKKNLFYLSDLNKRIRLFSKEYVINNWKNRFLQIFFLFYLMVCIVFLKMILFLLFMI